MMMKFLGCVVLIVGLIANAIGQEELRWKPEIEKLQRVEVEVVENSKGLILLTGSSSARMWKDVGSVFPEHTVVNNGFGGSQMHELLYFLDELVIDFKPDKVLIYEGDNDISAGKSVEKILKTTEAVIKKLRAELPAAQIYFISPKPSLARWELSQSYIDLNKKLKNYCESENQVHYIDVWYPMLGEDGKVMNDIFIEDGLHMNEKGYAIWAEVIGNAVKKY